MWTGCGKRAGGFEKAGPDNKGDRGTTTSPIIFPERADSLTIMGAGGRISHVWLGLAGVGY